MMSLRRAPIALRTPISRVRSVTDTSMMFITPMPPTIRPTDEITTIATATPPVIERNVWMSDSVVSIPKLSGAPNGTWRRTRNVSTHLIHCLLHHAGSCHGENVDVVLVRFNFARDVIGQVDDIVLIVTAAAEQKLLALLQHAYHAKLFLRPILIFSSMGEPNRKKSSATFEPITHTF